MKQKDYRCASYAGMKFMKMAAVEMVMEWLKSREIGRIFVMDAIPSGQIITRSILIELR